MGLPKQQLLRYICFLGLLLDRVAFGLSFLFSLTSESINGSEKKKEKVRLSMNWQYPDLLHEISFIYIIY